MAQGISKIRCIGYVCSGTPDIEQDQPDLSNPRKVASGLDK
jgi:hypothetical protein